jgi:ATP-binding cassette subfamily B (MDR/TAP) protein 7
MLASRLLLRPGLVPCSRHTAQTVRARPSPSSLLLHSSRRVFASTPRHRKDEASARTVQSELEKRKAEGASNDPVKAVNPATPTAKGGPLLAEQTVSNKEQRKADWAIIKDMAHYLWPKNDFSTRFRVGLSVGLLVGAKVGHHPVDMNCSCCCRARVDRFACRSSMSRFHSTSRPSSIP